MSTTPLIFLICSATSGAFFFRNSMSVEKSLISIGSGDHVRSPIRSPRMPGNSHSMPGSAALNLCAQLGDHLLGACARGRGLSLTRKSPVFGSAMDSASRAPVRRE